MANIIKKLKVSGVTYNLQPELADKATVAESFQGLWVNDSNNLELNSSLNPYATKGKLNLVAKANIQLKPGKGENIQIDNEQNTSDPTDIELKFCNGAMAKTNRVVRTKLNTTGLILDTANAHTTAGVEDTTVAIDSSKEKLFDKNEFIVTYRCDSSDNLIYAKHKARAIDLRCHDHGGIALQIAGHDSSNHENKIKFESDRITNVGSTADYNGEGGKGMEFGTFNNLHTSLFTGDYRFKGDAKVYGATRGALVSADGKTDYPTQSDDFKDIINEENAATWNEIIAVANAYKNNEIAGNTEGMASMDEVNTAIAAGIEGLATETFVKTQGYQKESDVRAIVAEIQASGSGIDLSSYVTETELDSAKDEAILESKNYCDGQVASIMNATASPIYNKIATLEAKVDSNADVTDEELQELDEKVDTLSGNVFAEINNMKKLPEYTNNQVKAMAAKNKDLKLNDILFVKSEKGNVELDASTFFHYIDSASTIYVDSAHTYTKEVSAATETESAITEDVLVVHDKEYANLNLTSNAKIKVKANESVEFETGELGFAVEITKTGKVKYANYESTVDTTKERYQQIVDNFPKINLFVTNEATSAKLATTSEDAAKVLGIQTVSVSIYELLTLVGRMNAAEAKIEELEGRLNALAPQE